MENANGRLRRDLPRDLDLDHVHRKLTKTKHVYIADTGRYGPGIFAAARFREVDLPPASGGVGSERHAALSMVIPAMPARASAGVR